MRRMQVVALLALAIPSVASAQAEAWWGHVTALADDSMRGRQTGSPEHREAAEYVAAAFQRAGLEPAGAGGWFQPVRFKVRRIAEPRSSVALVRGRKVEALAFGKDAAINLRSSSSGKVDAPLVFIGYGVRSPEHGHDDLAGLDLKGKVVVVLAGAAPPASPDRPSPRGGRRGRRRSSVVARSAWSRWPPLTPTYPGTATPRRGSIPRCGWPRTPHTRPAGPR